MDLRNARLESQTYMDAVAAQAGRLGQMQGAMTQMRGIAQAVRDIALSAAGGNNRLAGEQVDTAARDALETLTGFLNASQSGRFLFAGTAMDVKPFVDPSEPGPSGIAPFDAVADLVAGFGPIATAADVDALLDGPDGLAALFADTKDADADTVPDADTYSTSFYRGSAAPVRGRAGPEQEVAYGVTGADPAFRDLLMGLHALAALRLEDMPEAAYLHAADRGWRLVDRGIQGLLKLQGDMGVQEEALSRAQLQHETEIAILETRIVRMEEADPFDTSVRLSTLQSQLEATFAMTSRIARLSLVNYL